ncbi:MAG: efflux RND transporter permease subunit [Pseudomonas sp.]
MSVRAGMSGWCVRHPIATCLLTIASLFIGLLALFRLGVAPLPPVDFPTIQVQALLPGGSPGNHGVFGGDSAGGAVHRASPASPMLSPASALGSTTLTLQFDLAEQHRRRRPGGHRRDQRCRRAPAGGYARTCRPGARSTRRIARS